MKDETEKIVRGYDDWNLQSEDPSRIEKSLEQLAKYIKNMMAKVEKAIQESNKLLEDKKDKHD